MLTARTGENDRVFGLEQGADDYVTKPFSLRELTARVRAVLRRGGLRRNGARAGYSGDHLVADFDAVSVAVDGAAVRLTRREFELLRYLVRQQEPGRVARSTPRARLGLRPRRGDAIGRRARRPLRAKLRDAGRQIETVVGLGYRFVD